MNYKVIYGAIKQAAEVPISAVEDAIVASIPEAYSKGWPAKGHNDAVFPYAITPNTNAFVDRQVNVSLPATKEKKVLGIIPAGKSELVVEPRDAKGDRKVVKGTEKTVTEANNNLKKLLNSPEEWAAFKASLQQRRSDEIMSGAVLTGGATALASYLGLGLLPRTRKYKVIRALLGLAAGTGAGYLYHRAQNPSIYEGYDYDKILEAVKKSPKLERAIVTAVNPNAAPGEKITKITAPADADKATRAQIVSSARRFGTDALVGAASGTGAYLLANVIPWMRDKKLLKALLAGGVGVGSGLITDAIMKGKS